ncbi:MAG TPA: amidohydrolase family protein [Pyrinomonadaceae bacterium]|nr:amidohydrolase family protein [Pyrinomonadaceae bacterium]
MRRVHLRLLVATLALLCAIGSSAITTAQRTAVDTYAITNTRIVTLNGPVIERGTVVIRDGLIVAVGNVTAPPDARVIDGNGLTVYPGVIDAHTSLAMPEPSPLPSPQRPGGFQPAQPRPVSSSTGPNSSQPPGLQPEVRAEDLLRSTGESIESAKNAGITTVLTSPRTGIWIGQSALINLAGGSPQQMIVRSPLAMHVGFTPVRGSYPSSLMGVFSALRQMLYDAQAYREAQAIYERSPLGIKRPATDRSLEALIPVIEGRMPVVFQADREREIRGVLDLAEEFKLKAIIAGGTESWKVSDRLRKADVPVLLSLNFPRRTTAAMPQADPEPLRVLRDRVEAPKTAARLAAAKVRFAFQSGGMTNIADFRTNAGKTIENGLLKDDAIRALTISTARILGVGDRLGTIEAGKIANLTIMSGDLFDRTSRVAHVFIDGRPVDLRPATQSQTSAETTSTETPSSPLAGTWSINILLGNQSIPGTLMVNHQGDSITGSVETSLASSQFTGSSLENNGFRATMVANIQGETMDLTIEARVNGNEINGTISGPFGVATFTGNRQR